MGPKRFNPRRIRLLFSLTVPASWGVLILTVLNVLPVFAEGACGESLIDISIEITKNGPR